MAVLKDEVKAFIVQALACFDTPTQVSESVKEQFGIEVLRNHIAAYDPTKVSGKDLGTKWRTLFDETRKRFLEEVAAIPIANQAYRLRVLDRLVSKTERQGNTALTAQLLEQAAKETGGSFTNRQKVESTVDVKTPPTVKVVLNGVGTNPSQATE